MLQHFALRGDRPDYRDGPALPRPIRHARAAVRGRRDPQRARYDVVSRGTLSPTIDSSLIGFGGIDEPTSYRRAKHPDQPRFAAPANRRLPAPCATRGKKSRWIRRGGGAAGVICRVVRQRRLLESERGGKKIVPSVADEDAWKHCWSIAGKNHVRRRRRQRSTTMAATVGGWRLAATGDTAGGWDGVGSK